MEIIEVDKSTYKEIIPSPYHIFNSADFSHLNRLKADSVHYLLFKEGKYRLGMTGGIRENTLLSPFSAPFGGFSYLKEDIKISYIDEAIQSLTAWAKNKQIKEIRISLPPAIYQESFISKQINSLFRAGFQNKFLDLSYSFPTAFFDQDYLGHIWRNARKNINIARDQDMEFVQCKTENERQLAYEVIRKNRELKGFPLRMSWEQVRETTQLIPADFFLVYSKGRTAVASAIVFHVAENIVQVIYWGDIVDPEASKAMNFTAYKVFEHYKRTGIEIIDLGPSTENSIPNTGLCEFKESIGCEIRPKFTCSINL